MDSTNSNSSISSRNSARKEVSEEPWDYVSYKKVGTSTEAEPTESVQIPLNENYNNCETSRVETMMARNGTKNGYEGGQKKKLEVIYENIEPAGNKKRTQCIVLTVILLIVIIGGGAGVALWQLGIFSSDVVETNEESVKDKTNTNNDSQIGGEQDGDIIIINEDISTERATKATTSEDMTFNSTKVISSQTNSVTMRNTPVYENKKESTTTLQVTEFGTPLTTPFRITSSTSFRTMQTTKTTSTAETPLTTTTATTTITSKTSTTIISPHISMFTIPTTPTYLSTSVESLIYESRQPRYKKRMDKIMLLSGAIQDMKNDQEVTEIVGRQKKKGCKAIASWAPNFHKYIGTVYLPAIEAIVSCGYTQHFERYVDYPLPSTSCFIYYNYWKEWHHYDVLPDIGFYEGAFFSWHNKLVLFGGNAVHGENIHVITRTITVFEFSGVKDLYAAYEDSEEHTYIYDEFGSGDSSMPYKDDEDENNEGSGDSDESRIKVAMVDNAADMLKEYGPGVVEACAISLVEKESSVTFIVTGGKNAGTNGQNGRTLKKTLRAHLNLHDGTPIMGRQHDFLPSMLMERKQHGCSKTTVNGLDVMIVAGGSNDQNNPIVEVEFLNLKLVHSGWQALGELRFPRYGYPTIGQVLDKLIVVGGQHFPAIDIDFDSENSLNIDSEEDNLIHSVAKDIEIYDENLLKFRIATDSDNLGKSEISMTRYNYYGVMFPKSWCNNKL